jgi:hypothetical protein
LAQLDIVMPVEEEYTILIHVHLPWRVARSEEYAGNITSIGKAVGKQVVKIVSIISCGTQRIRVASWQSKECRGWSVPMCIIIPGARRYHTEKTFAGISYLHRGLGRLANPCLICRPRTEVRGSDGPRLLTLGDRDNYL